MASKKQVFETVSGEVASFCKSQNVSAKVTDGIMAILTNHLAPKASGASINLDEVTKKDANGKIVEIMCSVSGKFLPATAEYFYEEQAEGKGINGLKRLSRQAEAVRKHHIKKVAASEKAIMQDVLSKKITPEQGTAQLEKIKAEKPDFSSVGLIKKAE